jgi:SAM-dependent methyltransferase
MTGARASMLESVAALHETCSESASRFNAAHAEAIERYRRLISAGIDGALEQLQAEMAELSDGNEVVTTVGREMAEYVAWMQWSLWDLPVLAVALAPDPDDFRDAVTGCGLAYIAIRAFDDVIDQHFTYKGRRETLLADVGAAFPDVLQARALTTLAALMLCFEGLGRVAVTSTPVTSVLGSLRRAVVGAMMERTPDARWTPEDYTRMVRLKNVDYWRALYSAVDPQRRSPLYPFLERYYEVAQYLNDVEDYEEDVLRGQPNLLAVHDGNERCRRVDDPRPSRVTAAIEEMLADRVLGLGTLAAQLDDAERRVAESKLADLLAAARRLGLFDDGDGGDGGADGRPEDATDVRLYPFSELAEVLEQGGREAIVDVPCGACGSDARHELFRKQGFRFQRCATCTHVYVSPRISAELHDLVNRTYDDDGCHDQYLEVQRIYAEHICDLLRRRTPGPRLLDVGFGRGYVLQMAQVYGFDAHGIDSSETKVEPMRPLFGRRVARAVAGSDPLPWGSFDAVVLSHVLEHLPDPGATLRDVAAVMNPGGWIYVAVPDVDSMHYRIFGKQWDVVSPLVHLHYFTQRSLTAVLEAAGFEDVRRIRLPLMRAAVAPHWMRLMRQLGGSESSELTMLAKRPDDPAYYPLQAEG